MLSESHHTAKNLHTFAHRGEAQSFIQGLQLRACPHSGPLQNILWEGPQDLLLITGEGLFPALGKLTALLGSLNQLPLRIYNWGVAGALAPNLEKGEVYSIRTVYGHSGEEFLFHSFTNPENTFSPIDCLSAGKRVVTTEERQRLSSVAHCVDRELWALAYGAHLYKIPWESYKLISDQNIEDCALVLSSAHSISSELFHTYTMLSPSEKGPNFQNAPELPDFVYATFSQRRRFESLWSKLLAREKVSAAELWEKIFQEISLERFMEIPRPKDRMQALLEFLKQWSLPYAEHLEHYQLRMQNYLDQLKLKANVGKGGNPDELKIELILKNAQDEKELAEFFKHKNLQKVWDYWEGEGELHV